MVCRNATSVWNDVLDALATIERKRLVKTKAVICDGVLPPIAKSPMIKRVGRGLYWA